jgi:type IV secretory pathway VirD2 relaxase
LADLKTHSQAGAQVCDELLVAVTLFTAQMEIAVDGLHLVAQTQKDQKQSRAVRTSAQAYNNLGTIVQELVAADIVFDPVNE